MGSLISYQSYQPLVGKLEEKKIKVHEMISELMKISAGGSPKSSGDHLEILVLDDAEIEMLAEEMFQLSDELNEEIYSEEGEAIKSSNHVILLGLEDHSPLGLDCRACGYESCDDLSEAQEKEDIFQGPNCVFRLLDLGTALGNALNTAEMFKLDHDISIRGGLAGKHLGLIDSRVCLAVTANAATKRYHYTP